jgi:O-antigen biosynthesis protein
MDISIFTPTNAERWLNTCYNSLCSQTYNDWEWVLTPNHMDPNLIPERIRNDNRVRVIPSDLTGVGALKRFACEQCHGKLLVELDHDDRLTPNALDALSEAAKTTPDGFYYSDFVSLFPDGRSEIYGSHYGWEGIPFEFEGEKHTAMRAFEPSARSLCEIYYTPNHVRAWSRRAYDLAGGYDANLAIGDDHDLVCRTYLAGIPFVRIPKVLYIYSSHPDSTSHKDNAAVQVQQRTNMARYTYPLIYEECKRHQKSMIDLGLAAGHRTGFQVLPFYFDGIDAGFAKLQELPADSVGCFWVTDVLQRIPMTSIAEFFNLIYRALTPGGWVLFQSPSTDDGEGHAGRGAFQDPGHVSFWNVNSFWYYSHRDYAKHVRGLKARFQLVRCWTEYPTPWHKSNFIPYVHANMYALKGQRAPGLSTI